MRVKGKEGRFRRIHEGRMNWGQNDEQAKAMILISMILPFCLARISHRFLLNGYNWLDNNELWGSAKYGLSLRWCSVETSKRQAREAVLSLRSAWSRARARSRRGSRSALPRIASRICEMSGLAASRSSALQVRRRRGCGRNGEYLTYLG